jgi:hypothetical protein
MFLLHFCLIFLSGRCNKKYIDIFSNLLLTFVCLFLILRFHPFRKHELRDFDATIIFGSAVLLLTNAGLTNIIANDISNVITNGKII